MCLKFNSFFQINVILFRQIGDSANISGPVQESGKFEYSQSPENTTGSSPVQYSSQLLKPTPKPRLSLQKELPQQIKGRLLTPAGTYSLILVILFFGTNHIISYSFKHLQRVVDFLHSETLELLVAEKLKMVGLFSKKKSTK